MLVFVSNICAPLLYRLRYLCLAVLLWILFCLSVFSTMGRYDVTLPASRDVSSDVSVFPVSVRQWWDAHALRPHHVISYGLGTVDYVIGVPTTGRMRAETLAVTLRSLFNALDVTTDPSVTYRVVVQVSDNDTAVAVATAEQVGAEWREWVESGLLEVVVPSPALFAGVKHPSDIEDPRSRAMSRQVLDHSHLMLHSFARGCYYLHLADDVTATPDFLSSIHHFRLAVGTDAWVTLEFTSVPLLGVLFKTSGLPALVSLMLQHYQRSTADVILRQYVDELHPPCPGSVTSLCLQELGVARILHRPSLFNHTGNGTDDDVIDTNFPVRYEPFPLQHVPIYINPPAYITSTLTPKLGHSIERTYQRRGHYFAERPKRGDTITFRFVTPVALEEFFIRVWHSEHPRSRFDTETYLDVLPLYPKEIKLPKNYFFRYRRRADGYVTVGRVNERGIMEGPLGSGFGKLRAVRMRVGKTHRQTVIIRELQLKLMLVDTRQRACCQEYWTDPFPRSMPGVRLYDSDDL